MTDIDINAFFGCTSLKDITLPTTLEYASSAFSNSGIVTAAFRDGATKVPDSIFRDCKNLKNVYLPDSLKVINDQSFQNCTSLETIEIPENVWLMNRYAFFGCTSLKSVIIPKSVTKIYPKAVGYINEETVEKDFVIYGYRNTEAQRYANENNIKFVPLDKDLLGDVDLNGEVNIFDVTLVQLYSAQSTTLTDEQLANADVNGDGYVNIFDATAIQLMLAGF